MSKMSYIPKLQSLVLSPQSGMDREPDVVYKDDSQTFVCDSTLTRLIAGEDFNAGDYKWMVEFDFWRGRLEFSRHHSSDIVSTLRQLTVISNWFTSSFHRIPCWPSEREINLTPPISVNARSSGVMPHTHIQSAVLGLREYTNIHRDKYRNRWWWHGGRTPELRSESLWKKSHCVY